MTPSALRLSIGVILLLAFLPCAQAPAQPPMDKAPAKEAAPKTDAIETYRELFKKPETAPEYWKSMQFEIEVGRYDIAAMHLKGLLGHATEEQLLELQRQHSMN